MKDKWKINRNFPGGPAVKTLPSNAGVTGSIPGQGAKTPHASWPKNQNMKQKQYWNKFNKDFKNGSHTQKIFKKIKKYILKIKNKNKNRPWKNELLQNYFGGWGRFTEATEFINFRFVSIQREEANFRGSVPTPLTLARWQQQASVSTGLFQSLSHFPVYGLSHSQIPPQTREVTKLS